VSDPLLAAAVAATLGLALLSIWVAALRAVLLARTHRHRTEVSVDE